MILDSLSNLSRYTFIPYLACIIHKPKIRQKIDAFGLGVVKIVFGEGDVTVGYRA